MERVGFTYVLTCVGLARRPRLFINKQNCQAVRPLVLLSSSMTTALNKPLPRTCFTRGEFMARIPWRNRSPSFRARSASFSSSRTESADLQLWVPKADIPLARWTSSEDQRLVKLKSDGNSWRDISRALSNRSARAVESHWSQMQKASETIFMSCA